MQAGVVSRRSVRFVEETDWSGIGHRSPCLAVMLSGAWRARIGEAGGGSPMPKKQVAPQKGGRQHEEEKRCHLTVAGVREQAGGKLAPCIGRPPLRGRRTLPGRERLQDSRKVQATFARESIKGYLGTRRVHGLQRRTDGSRWRSLRALPGRLRCLCRPGRFPGSNGAGSAPHQCGRHLHFLGSDPLRFHPNPIGDWSAVDNRCRHSNFDMEREALPRQQSAHVPGD